MWNDKVEASPKVRREWLVPTFFIAFAFAGACVLLAGAIKIISYWIIQ